MKTKVRIIALLLVLVMLLPMVVACDETAVQLASAQDKTPTAGELAQTPEDAEKLDAKALLLELLKDAEINANKAIITAKFKGDISVSFLDPAFSFGTSDADMVEYLDEDGYLTIPVSEALEYIIGDPDIMNIITDMFVGTALGGDYGSLEEFLNSLIGNIDADTVIATYGSLENYAAITLIKYLIIGSLDAREQAFHNEDGSYSDYKDYCSQDIEYITKEFNSLINASLTGEAELVDLLEFISDNDLILALVSGTVCGATEANYETAYVLSEAIWEMVATIKANQVAYDGNGNYGLEVYYPAIEENLAALIYVFAYNTEGNYSILSYGYDDIDEEMLEPLKKYLSSENGPVAELDLAKIILAFAATGYAYACVNEIAAYSYDGSMYYAGFYSLSEEKMYVFDYESDSMELVEATEDYTIIGPYMYSYTQNPCNVYAVVIDGVPYEPTNSFEEALELAKSNNGDVVIVYDIIYGEDLNITESSYVTVYNKLTDLLYSAIDAKPEGNDAALSAAAIAAYALTYLEYDNYDGKLMDSFFAGKFIISALSGSVLDNAEDTFAEIAAILGITEEEEIEYFVSRWIMTVELEEGETLAPADMVLALIIEVLNDEGVASDFEGWYGISEVSEITAAYLYAKYLSDTPNEDLSDGMPVATVMMILSEYVYLYSDEYEYNNTLYDLYNYYVYNDSDLWNIINYEDILALFVMINREDFDMLEMFDTPFDYLKREFYRGFFNSFAEQYWVDGSSDGNALYYKACDVADYMADRLTIRPEYLEMDVMMMFSYNFMMMTGNLEDNELLGILGNFANAVYVAMQAAGVYPLLVDADEAFFGFVLPVLFSTDASEELSINAFLEYFFPDQSPEAIEAIGNQLAALYYDATNNFESVKTLDNEFVIGMLSELSVLLSENDADVTALNAFIAKLELVDGDLTPELILDNAFTEFFGEEYTTLTDVILTLSNPEAETDDIVAALEVAIAEIPDIQLVGYLRAFAAALTETAPDADGIVNALAILAAAYKYPMAAPEIIPALFMTKAEYDEYYEGNDQAIDLREWVTKYIAQYTETETIEIAKAVVDYLVIMDFYDDVPEETDEKYYEKLVAVFLIRRSFLEEDHADVLADIIINPENLYLYGEDLMEIAQAQDDPRVSIAFLLLSTKAFLEVEDSSTVDWDTALAYIPELIASFTDYELDIANYEALSELLRPAFAEEVNTSVVTSVVPYETTNEIIYVFTVDVALDHVAIEGDFEIIIEIRCPKAA